MLLSLITEDQYTTLYLPNRPEGMFFVCDPQGGERLFAVSGESGKWKIRELAGCQFVDTQPESLWNGMMCTVRIRGLMEKASLYAQEESPRNAKFARCPVPDDFSFSYGSAEDNLFRTDNPYVSPRAFTMECKGRNWAVKDSGSPYGTFVNGRNIGGKTVFLRPGDLVSVLNQKFIVLPGLLAFNAQGLDTDRLKGKLHALKVPDLKEIQPFAEEKEREWFHRAPRFTDSLNEQKISVQAPPSVRQQQTDKTATMLSMGPALSSGLIMMLGGMNPVYGIGMAASSLIWPQLGRKRTEKLQKAEEEKRQMQYEEYLQKVDAELEELRARQTEALKKKAASPSEEAALLQKSKTTLWNRRPDQSDFLDVRLGTGDIPMEASITFPAENEAEINDDPMIGRLREIEKKPRVLEGVPIFLPLERYRAVGVSGPEPLRMQAAERILLQLAMHAGYDDLKLCIFGKLPPQSACLAQLPHTWDNTFTFHMVAEDMDALSRLTASLDPLLSAYTDKRQGAQDERLPHLVILIADSDMAQSGMLQRMLFRQDLRNVHVITLAEHSRQLPSRTELAVSVRERKGRMAWQQEENRCTIDFVPDLPVTDILERAVSVIANTFLDLKKEAVQIPDVVPFLDLFGVQDVHSLNLLHRWEHADPMRSLQAPVGVSEDGNLCRLDLHERADGPHGLIAGTTGSGKSELLMSYILSAAVSFSPEELAFVLIDYKGGGMAQAFEHLPHTAGIITNLDGNEISRSLMSIQSELQRRQKIFSDTERALGIKKADIYRYQQLYRERKVSEPLPHLVIITDEFAELKTQEPEFLQQLISAARIGRSLGVHLILSTQKPAGVVDEQIWSNSNFRLCLRVQDPRDSQDVLKCPDAAALTHVGRFYKQIGYGETMIKAQSAWTGADYAPGAQAMPVCCVEVLDPSGDVVSRGELSVSKQKESASQLDAVTEYIAEIGEREGLRTRRLWLPPLEENITLGSLYRKYRVEQEPWTLDPVIGELDDPSTQSRSLVRMNLGDGKNAIVYGAIGSGKLQFITTALADLMAHHTPEELQIYILDYADDGLQALSAAPHIGDVLCSDDSEKLNRFMSMMEEAIRERKRKLGGGMASGNLDQRLKDSGTNYILVILHHLLTLQNQLDDRIGDLVRLMSDGPRYGIFFLATAETDSGLRFNLQQRFALKYVLQQDRDEEYMSLLGRTGGMKPAPVRGRGLLRENDKLYEFQTAVPDGDLQELCENLRDSWTGPAAKPVRIMPDRITPQEMKQYLDPAKPLDLPVGLDVETLDPVFWPFGKRMIHLVPGIDRDVTMLLSGLLPLFTENGMEVTAFDPAGDFAGADGIESLSLQESQERLNAMFEECRKIKASLSAGETPGDRPVHVYVVPALTDLMNRLPEDAKDTLKSILLKARPEWKWVFILCDLPQSFASVRSAFQSDSAGNRMPWFDTSVSKTDVLLAGGSLSALSHMQLSGASGSLFRSVAYPMGYVVLNGAARPVKLVSGQEF